MRTHAKNPTKHLAAIAAMILAAALLPACTSSSSDDNNSGDSQEAIDHSEESGEEEGESEEGESEEEAEAEGEGWNEEIEEKAEARGLEMPEDAFLFNRLMPSGVPSRSAFAAAKAQATVLNKLGVQLAKQAAGPAGGHGQSWQFLGPKNVGGRIVDGVVDPTRRDTIYVAAASNGVWRSTDAGETFTSVWPEKLTHAMGALAITPNGTVFAGTGETNPGGGSITYGGDGIYRSTNDGRSWQRVGLESSGTIGRIVVDPDRPSRIWAAVSGNLFIPGGQRGVYVSNNGGDSWQRSLTPPNGTTGATDLAIDPADNNHIIATMWDHIRRPDARVYTGIGSGAWETHNGGQSWQRLGPAQGLQAPSANTGRMGVAFAPSDSDRVYLIYANNETGAFENFFRSDDNGDSWTRPAGADQLTDSQSVYGWWFARLYVDPDDPDRMYTLGLEMYETEDGAETFDTIPDIHVDQHVVMYDPREPDRVYIGNDGGLYVSEEDGADGTFTQSDDQPWSQYSGLDVSEQNPSYFAGGLQDNGTRASWTDPKFDSIFGGDGQRALIDPKDIDNYYACAQYGVCGGFDNGSDFEVDFTSERFPYFTQIEFDPHNPEVMYGGGNRLNKSTDGGHTFTPISEDLGKGEAGDEPNPLYRNHYGTISTLAIAPSDSNVVWVGTDNGYLYRSNDAGVTWTELLNPVRDHLWIQRVVIDPDDKRTVYLTFSGYREGDNAPYVLRTTNAGQSWQNISANLPHAPVNDLAVVKKKLYVATDVGVFTSSEKKVRWSGYGKGMPQLIVTDLRYVAQAKKLFVATFGMGVWSTKV